jgi:phosphate transport system permease protein
MANLEKKNHVSVVDWIKSGQPGIWITAAAIALSSIAVVGLLMLLAVRGFGHFWPANIASANYNDPASAQQIRIIGEIVEREDVTLEQLKSAGFKLDDSSPIVERYLMKLGNRDVSGADFRWFLSPFTGAVSYPETAMVIERHEWGNFYGFLRDVKEQGNVVASSKGETELNEPAWTELEKRLERALEIHERIFQFEQKDIGSINYALERLRLKVRRAELDKDVTPQQLEQVKADVVAEKAALEAEYAGLQQELEGLYTQVNRDSITVETMGGQIVDIPLGKIVRVLRPNSMSIPQKLGAYFSKLHEFLTDVPREANTEGGIYPAIFGTVIMVMLMAIMVTPFGVVAAVYLREYATQGIVTKIVRIAVNNLAGVPSIVYGVFGLGFFIYFLGANIDKALFAEALPSPTFGTPGLLWASLTLALLTLPVVIVATEEGLARIPRSVREGSLALGATKAETIWRVVLPMASPAMMTGLILAVARAAGEVAPLMLVGVVKLAPALPVDANYPYFHLDQKFMHLGFHIYDVGFQSPNVEAARPLVYATALLLVIVIAALNLTAVAVRNNLREKFKALES